MDLQQKTNRMGRWVILFACMLRLAMSGIPAMLVQRLAQRSRSIIHTYVETGRNVRFSASSEEIPLFFRESPAPWMPQPEKPSFSPEDAGLVQMDYDCTYRPDLEDLLTRPLDWDLTGEEPTVLILHTHTTESYTKDGEVYTETSAYRTLDEQYNMLCIGARLTELLSQAGIGVIHDRNIHDHPSYNGSYVHSRQAVEEILKQYPSIRLVLDLHRDALEKNGMQMKTVTQLEGRSCAQLMLVVGTDISRQSHENWQDNLALALKFQVQLERLAPGIMRPVNLREQRFNQDLSPGALLIEVGTAGNTRREALEAAKKLAEAVVCLAEGAAT